MGCFPGLSEVFNQGNISFVLWSISCLFAGYDVFNACDWENVVLDSSVFCFLVVFDSIRGIYYIKFKWSCIQLDEVFVGFDVFGVLFRQYEP